MNAELVKEIDKSIKLLEELQQMQLEKYGSRRFQADYAMLTLEKLSALNQSQPSLPSVEEELPQIIQNNIRSHADNMFDDKLEEIPFTKESFIVHLDTVITDILRQHWGWKGRS